MILTHFRPPHSSHDLHLSVCIHGQEDTSRYTGSPFMIYYRSTILSLCCRRTVTEREQHQCSVVDLCGFHWMRWQSKVVLDESQSNDVGSYLLYTWSVFYLLIKKNKKKSWENVLKTLMLIKLNNWVFNIKFVDFFHTSVVCCGVTLRVCSSEGDRW